jgi:uncharacterized membrane protein
MQWTTFAQLYVIALPVFFIIDIIWLGFIASDFYNRQLAHLRGPINWPAAVAFYLIFLAGLTYFATYPAFLDQSVLRGALLGALFGFFVYAGYDLTNLATLKDWPLTLALVDILWGTVLGASVGALTVYVALLVT